MHSPSLLTPALATTVIEDHTKSARLHRSRGHSRVRSRRRGASRILAPRGRLAPPVAH